MAEFRLGEEDHQDIKEILQILNNPDQLEDILQGRREISTVHIEDLKSLLEQTQ